MIIIVNDDPVYLSWVQRHRHGYVLATRRKATKRNTLLHRASCPEIRKSKTKRTHWTTGGRVKACSEDQDELTQWAREQIGRPPKTCDSCSPSGEALSTQTDNPVSADEQHLTKLDNDILSAVLESAVINLDNQLSFRMTVADVAAYLSKTPVQITDAMRRLVAQQLLEVETESANETPLAPTARVFPTASALKTVPAFAVLDAQRLQKELETLHR